MIISKTPYRISFFGGGSDYPNWFNRYTGKVLSTTINKHIYISCRFLPNFFNHKYRIVWSKIGQLWGSTWGASGRQIQASGGLL